MPSSHTRTAKHCSWKNLRRSYQVVGEPDEGPGVFLAERTDRCHCPTHIGTQGDAAGKKENQHRWFADHQFAMAATLAAGWPVAQARDSGALSVLEHVIFTLLNSTP